MNRFFAVAVALLPITHLLAGECRIASETIADGVKEYTLGNGIIAVKCVPETSGVISGFTSLPEGRDMISPLECLVVKDDLLPTQYHINRTGLRMLARGVKMSAVTTYKVRRCVSDGQTAEVVMAGRGYYRWNATAIQRVTLRRGESRVRISLTLTAAGKFKNKLLLWINGIASMGEARDRVLMPVRNVDEPRAGLGMAVFSADGIFLDCDPRGGDIYAAARAPWIARTSAERSGVLVLKLDDAFTAEGVFCAWKNGTSTLHTTEAIYGPLALKKGETREIVVEYIYFSKLTGLRAVSGPYGLDREDRAVLVASAAPVPAGKITLVWRDRAGKSGTLGEFPLPALTPGEVAKIDLSGYDMPDHCALIGSLPDGSHFELPELVRIAGE